MREGGLKMARDANTKLFKDLEKVINKHFTAMQDEIMESKNDAMIEIFPSTLLQLLVNELYRTSNPIVVTATVLAVLTQQMTQEAGKIVNNTIH